MPTTEPWRIGWLFAAMSGCPFVKSRTWMRRCEAVAGTADLVEQRARSAAELRDRRLTVPGPMRVADRVGAALRDAREQRLSGERPLDRGLGAEAVAGYAAHGLVVGSGRMAHKSVDVGEEGSVCGSGIDFCGAVRSLVQVVIPQAGQPRDR